MKVDGIPTRTIRSVRGGEAIEIIDQTLLPYRYEKRVLSDWRDCVEAIDSMRVRGAPLIGITGAWAVVLATREDPSNAALIRAAERIQGVRPTAVNLSWAVQRMLTALLPREPALRFEAAVKLAETMTQEDVMCSRAIGEAGAAVITKLYQELRRPLNILTHCNAGWLATVDYGTALAPVYFAFERGIPLHVWVDETRPRNQGLLTAWELGQQGVPHTIIADNAGGHLMQHGDVDAVIVGADRITRRGDVANKIGTYLKALAAKDNDVPFYVAAPSSTIDWKLTDGKREIEIENRSAAEVLSVRGLDHTGHDISVQIASPDESAANPAFDVTHNRFVTGIITERGVFAPTELAAGFQDVIAHAL
ncbi:S-methyl-5-thioribose-1-phosphate isomerase [Sutterella sp.]|uniref:S-methyl-5-thioribose-1-phosphate isomerase n=1 Tax=Sutterella sp. TaxID=1981025 RepID=UPI0026DEE7AB|nr:S-methyl-5-thioribose-1-phosphate isomerase [Sutterella sp.]MDO5530695.1 S-methyl-5-thioribose-1-phosphate isomerase [Sutterella sp.]